MAERVGSSIARLISVQVVYTLEFPQILTHRYYGMSVGCPPRAFRFRRLFLVTLLDEQKSNDIEIASATGKHQAQFWTPIETFPEGIPFPKGLLRRIPWARE